MTEQKKTEIEWQFDVDDVKRAHKLMINFLKRHHFRIKDKNPKTQIDSYFDTKDFVFHRANLSLRVRSTHRGFEACIKSFGDETSSAAVKERTEITERAQGGAIADVLSLHGKVGRRIAFRHPHDSMHKLFAIKTERRKIGVFHEKRQFIEIALDVTKKASVGAGKPLSFSRLEIECIDEKDVSLAESFVDEVKKYFKKHGQKLEASAASKYKTMIDKEGVTIPKFDLGTPNFDEDQDPRHYANAVLRKYLTHAFSQEWGARIGLDAGFVHQMRVGLRKFRTAMRVFKKYLPSDIKKHEDSLRDLLDALGAVRDLDVHTESAHEWLANADPKEQDAIQEVMAHFQTKQHSAHKQLVNIFDTQEYIDLVERFRMLLQDIDNQKDKGKTKIRAIVHDLVKKQIKAFKRKGKHLTVDSDGKDFHKFRIAGKKVRYTLEFFEPLHPDEIGKLIKKMAEIQDALGVINDCRVARERLFGMANPPHKKFSDPALYEIMKASRYYSSMERDFRKQIVETYKRMEWRDFLIKF